MNGLIKISSFLLLFFLFFTTVQTENTLAFVDPTEGRIKDQCTSDTECNTTDFCTAKIPNSGRICSTKKEAGKECMGSNECKSGNCIESNKTKKCADAATGEGILKIEPIAPTLLINIPTLKPFTTKGIKIPDSEGYIYIPFLGQYIAGLYRWAILVAGLVATTMIIWGGFIYMTSAGNAELAGQGKERISHAILGLVLLLASYTLLYIINPDLVSFKSLKIKVIEREILADLEEGPSESTVPATVGATGPITTRTFTPNNINDFCFPITDGFAFNRNNWGQTRKDKNGLLTRCHAGIDLFTDWKNVKGKVVSMTAGEIIAVMKTGFTNCSSGISPTSSAGAEESTGSVYVYDSQNQVTYVYGELNQNSMTVKQGDNVSKGTQLGTATKCQMLHLEIYKGKGSNKGKPSGWYLFDQFKTSQNEVLPIGDHACATPRFIDILNKTGNTLLDPSQLIETIKDKKC